MAKPALDFSRITLFETMFLECAIVQPGPDYTAKTQFAHINLTVGTEFSYARDTNYLSIRLKLQVQPVDAEDRMLPLEGRFHTHFGFAIENLEELLEPAAPSGEQLPNFMLTLSLLSVAYSTSRGMILGKVAGTVFEGYCLPLMDARELLALSADGATPHREPAEALVRARPALEAKAKKAEVKKPAAPKTTRKK